MNSAVFFFAMSTRKSPKVVTLGKELLRGLGYDWPNTQPGEEGI